MILRLIHGLDGEQGKDQRAGLATQVLQDADLAAVLGVEELNFSRGKLPRLGRGDELLGHLLRRVGKILDLGFVYREVAGFYGRNGHVSADPVVIIKLMLLLFLDDVKSERELMRILPLRIDYLWFLGFGGAVRVTS